jgi:hypothetical protein
MTWTAEQERKLQFAQQQKAGAKRAFYPAWSALQGLRKDFMRENDRVIKRDKYIDELQKEPASRRPKPEVKAEASVNVLGGQKSKKKAEEDHNFGAMGRDRGCPVGRDDCDTVSIE